ncbi:MAG: outer membrane protein assembly factor BamB family protein [Acidimicrobiales bacterium]
MQRSSTRIAILIVFVGLLVLLVTVIAPRSSKHSAAPRAAGHRSIRVTPTPKTTTGRQAKDLKPGPNLAPGSNPAVLPSDVLIADEGNNRLQLVNPQGNIVWQFPQPGDLAPGQTFLRPDDAFFTPNGKDIIATEETDQVISLISVAQHRIIWRYGHPGLPGSSPGYVSNPDDALMMPNGDVITADIKNCNILLIGPGSHVPLATIGITDPYCYHQPPYRWASPNGAFPLTNGNYLITEIDGDWVDELNIATGKVLWSTHPPGFTYPSDTNQVGPNRYLSVDYTKPGAVEEFTKHGRLLWRFAPTGANALNHPSLCAPIPTNGDILCNDDHNDRIIVIDPRTDKIVWQYGHTGVAGTAPGYLSGPDGCDLAPPYSLLMTHASTMGLPGRLAPGTVLGVPAGSSSASTG